MEIIDMEALLKQLTPEYLVDVVRRLAAGQSAGDRDAVSITPLIDALTCGREFGQGREGWQAYLRLKQMIRDTLASIPNMRYVEGDS
ncbi:MAG: hypothetical protein ACYCZF_07485 [Anaerolineae bacterium]